MKIKVLKDIKAASCPRGIELKEYKTNSTYEIYDDLADVFITEGWGELVEDKPYKIELASKVIEKSPEDKAIKSVRSNKAEEKASKSRKK